METAKHKIRLIDSLPFLAVALSIFFFLSIGSYTTMESYIFFSAPLYIACFVVVISLFAIYWVYEYKYEKPYNNWIFASFFTLIILINLIVTLVQPNEISAGSLVIKVSAESKWFSICCFACKLLAIYYFVFIFPKKFASLKLFNLFAYSLLTILLIATIYSYCKEASLYATLFDDLFNKKSFDSLPEISSFFTHSNAYAMFLIMGLFACLFIDVVSGKHVIYLGVIFILLNVLFTCSLGGIAVAFLMTISYILIRLFINYRKHKITTTIATSILAVAVIIFVILSIISTCSGGSLLKPLNDFYDFIIHGNTSRSRVNIWNNCVTLLNENAGWVFGRGYILFQQLLYPLNVINYDNVYLTHNGALSLIGAGGVIFLLVYSLVIIRAFVSGLKNYKHNKTSVLTCLFATGTFVLYTLIESNQDLLLFFIYPLLCLDAEVNKEVEYNKKDTLSPSNDMNEHKVSFVLSLFAIVVSGISYPLIASYGISMLYIPFVIFVGFAVLGLLRLLVVQKNDFSLSQYLKLSLINILGSAIFITLSTLYQYLFKCADFGSGMFISIMFSIMFVMLYLAIPSFKVRTGLSHMMVSFDSRIDDLLMNKYGM